MGGSMMEELEPGPEHGAVRDYILSRFLCEAADWQPATQSHSSFHLGKHKDSALESNDNGAEEKGNPGGIGAPFQALTLPASDPINGTGRTEQFPCLIETATRDPGFGFAAPPLRGDDTPTPCTDQETSNQQPRAGGGLTPKDNPPPSRQKRTLRCNESDRERDADEQRKKRRAPSTAFPGPQPQPKTFPCPFRRQSPMTFHVRAHVKCANQEFRDFASLKKHVTSEHYSNRFLCPRCRGNFTSSEDVNRHLQNLEPCSLQASLAVTTRLELGISEDTRGELASRKDDKKVNNWDRLWKVLFGEHVPVKDPTFYPVVELEEVLVEFNAESPSFLAALDTHLKDLVGELAYEGYKNEVETIKTFVVQWMRELLDNCRRIPSRLPNIEHNRQDNAHVPHQGQPEKVQNTVNKQGRSRAPTTGSVENMPSLLTDHDATMAEMSDFLDLDWVSIDPSCLELDRPAPLVQYDFPDGDIAPQPAEVHDSWKNTFTLHLQSSRCSVYLPPPGPNPKAPTAQNLSFPPTPAPSQPSASTPGPSFTASTPALSFTTASTPARTSASKPRYPTFARLNDQMSRQAFQNSLSPEMAGELHLGQLPFGVGLKQLKRKFQ
ncbi:hypothetical protein QBC34DRAFT_443509 [Podospora aff. communis PSN243]|uniref:C2H2-type domain-containing protein n=1 Tax=Podospora aff. communis PSN243 TaxID=3040156 RepID=A0AAV9G7S9_9PEZI|nr:hypothetical protein QBC34DRAFT_443509 [Podospora aff. communis PSN243]